MSFDTYANFLVEIGDYLARDDLTAKIPGFVVLFEKEAARRLRVRQAETTVTLTNSAGTVAVPSDFQSLRRLTWTGSSRIELSYVHPSMLQAYYPTSPTDTPKVYTFEGNSIIVRPVDSTAVELVYNATPTAAVSALSWLFTNHPDCYLAGTMAEAWAYIEDDTQEAKWTAKRDAKFTEIASNEFNYIGSPTVRVLGPTP